jgi:hypothetical protein
MTVFRTRRQEINTITVPRARRQVRANHKDSDFCKKNRAQYNITRRANRRAKSDAARKVKIEAERDNVFLSYVT